MTTRAELLAWIGLPEAAASVAAITPDHAVVAALREGFLADSAPPPGADPLLAAAAALDALPAMVAGHRARGLAAEISQATAGDLALWMREHRRRHGAWGLSEGGWLRHHLSGRLLRLGRLQFMPAACRLRQAHLGAPVADGEPVLEVHIPAGAPLHPDACRDAFARSAAAFADAAWMGWFCRSWLLAPRLAEVLPPGSNIRAFQSCFAVLPGEMDDRQAIERIFGAWPLNPAGAPRATALQRAALELYAAGGRLDGAAGFRPRLPPPVAAAASRR